MIESITDEQMNDILRGMQVGFVLMDSRCCVVRFSATGLSENVVTEEDAIGRSYLEVWPDLPLSVSKKIKEVMKTRRPLVVDFDYQWPTGPKKWYRARLFPWGEGLAAFFIDVTEKMIFEQRLKESMNRFSLMTRATDDVLWEWTPDQDGTLWSEGATEMFGLGRNELRQPTSWWENLIHPDDRARVKASFDEAVVSPKVFYWREEYRIRQRHGYGVVLDKAFITRDQDGNVSRIVGALTDLTELREAEKRVEGLQNEIVHMSRVNAMGTMASTLAHELNQPLTAIVTYLSGVKDVIESLRYPDDIGSALRIGVDEALANALRAGDVIRRLRMMVRKSEAKRGRLNVRSVVEESTKLALIGFADKAIDIDVEIDGDLEIMADAIQIQQVLVNLIRNASEAMETTPTKRLTVRAQKDDDYVEICVGDTGIGIEDEMKSKLFEPFFSSKASGMGIGLPISRTIIEAHGGSISAEDNEPAGTVMRIWLPGSDVVSDNAAVSS